MKVFPKTLLICTALLIPVLLQARADSNIKVEVKKLLETDKSWDGITYQAYPKGTPQLSVLKITIAPNSSLAWHKHPIPNAAYIERGELTVEKKLTGEKRYLKAGEVLPEMMNSVHRGYTGKEGATLIVFYAGQKGIPLSQPEK